jgi:hypothetical protein
VSAAAPGSVPVLYLPGDPNRAQIADFLHMWAGQTFCLGLGVVLLGTGLRLRWQNVRA